MVCRGYLKASRPDDADMKWSPGRRDCMQGNVIGSTFTSRRMAKKPSTPLLCLSLRLPRLLMAESKAGRTSMSTWRLRIGFVTSRYFILRGVYVW